MSKMQGKLTPDINPNIHLGLSCSPFKGWLDRLNYITEKAFVSFIQTHTKLISTC
jgi:hypothetical protein